MTRPGDGVARIRVALTDINKTKALRKLVPVAVVLGAGGASMEAEIVDSRTGRQLAAIVESQEGSRLPLEGLGRLADAKGVIDGWARRLRERLDALR